MEIGHDALHIPTPAIFNLKIADPPSLRPTPRSSRNVISQSRVRADCRIAAEFFSCRRRNRLPGARLALNSRQSFGRTSAASFGQNVLRFEIGNHAEESERVRGPDARCASRSTARQIVRRGQIADERETILPPATRPARSGAPPKPWPCSRRRACKKPPCRVAFNNFSSRVSFCPPPQPRPMT